MTQDNIFIIIQKQQLTGGINQPAMTKNRKATGWDKSSQNHSTVTTKHII